MLSFRVKNARTIIVLLLWSLWTGTVMAMLKSNVIVHIPDHLVKSDGYVHQQAEFGKPPAIGSILSHMYYYDGDSCTHIDTTKGYPIRPGPTNTTMYNFRHPYILAVNRSRHCNLVRQARVAQNGGAAALIVMDHTCLCSDKDCEPTKPCQDERPEIPDDGTGADINIPTVLVRKEAGDQFKETLEKDGVGILMELRFDYMSDPGKIDYHIWTTPTDSLSRYLIRSTSLETLAGAFAEHNVIFIPHQFLYPGHIYLSCGQEHNGTAGVSSSSGQEKACDELCTNDGRYCAISDLNHNISGAEIVTESLRRICIRETHQADKGVIWWKYARSHQTQCYNHEPTLFSDPKCIERVMKEAGINIHSVNDCMEKSGGTTGTAANTKLDEEILAQMRHGVVQHPWASINRRLTDKAPLPMDTLQLLCDELEYKPTPCHHCAWCYDDPIGCVQLGSCEAARKRKNDKPTKNKPKGGGFWRFLKVVFWTTLVGGAGYAAWLYSHSNAGSVPMLSNNFRDQARGVLTDYMQLNSEDDPIQQHEEFMMQQQQPFGS